MSGSYEAIGWLRPDTDFTPDAGVQSVAKWIPEAEVSRRGNSVMASLGGWEIWVHLSESPHVAEEADEFAEWHADDPRGRSVRGCKRRIEVECSEEDPQMSHFNYYVFVLQALEEFRGVVLFDPANGEFI